MESSSGDGTPDTAGFERAACLSLLAAVFASHASEMASVATTLAADDVELLDPPAATCYRVAVDLASTGIDPSALEVQAELLRLGLFAGHRGELVKTRMLDSATRVSTPARLSDIAATVLAIVFRARLVAAGNAIAITALNGAEDDAWQVLVREGITARSVWDRLSHLRSQRGESVA